MGRSEVDAELSPPYKQVWIQERNRFYNIKERVTKEIVPGGGRGRYVVGKVMLRERGLTGKSLRVAL